jgi:hypothetical protein
LFDKYKYSRFVSHDISDGRVERELSFNVRVINLVRFQIVEGSVVILLLSKYN